MSETEVFVQQVRRNLGHLGTQRLTKTHVTSRSASADSEPDVVLRYHATDVVTLRGRSGSSGPAVVLNTGGFITATTVRRMNQALDGTGFRVVRHRDEFLAVYRKDRFLTAFVSMAVLHGDELVKSR